MSQPSRRPVVHYTLVILGAVLLVAVSVACLSIWLQW